MALSHTFAKLGERVRVWAAGQICIIISMRTFFGWAVPPSIVHPLLRCSWAAYQLQALLSGAWWMGTDSPAHGETLNCLGSSSSRRGVCAVSNAFPGCRTLRSSHPAVTWSKRGGFSLRSVFLMELQDAPRNGGRSQFSPLWIFPALIRAGTVPEVCPGAAWWWKRDARALSRVHTKVCDATPRSWMYPPIHSLYSTHSLPAVVLCLGPMPVQVIVGVLGCMGGSYTMMTGLKSEYESPKCGTLSLHLLLYIIRLPPCTHRTHACHIPPVPPGVVPSLSSAQQRETSCSCRHTHSHALTGTHRGQQS